MAYIIRQKSVVNKFEKITQEGVTKLVLMSSDQMLSQNNGINDCLILNQFFLFNPKIIYKSAYGNNP